jgi:hypothetical protein
MLTVTKKQWRRLEEIYWQRWCGELVAQARRGGLVFATERTDADLVNELLPVLRRGPAYNFILREQLRLFGLLLLRIGGTADTLNDELSRILADPYLLGDDKLAALAAAAGVSWPIET